MADNSGYNKTGDVMAGAGQGAMQGFRMGAMTGNPYVAAAATVGGGVIGGIKGGKITDEDRLKKFATDEAGRILANPNEVAGFDAQTQAKNTAAVTRALDPKAYQAAAQNPETARRMQADIQKAGQAAVGTQAQMAAQAAQQQRAKVMQLLNVPVAIDQRNRQLAAMEERNKQVARQLSFKGAPTQQEQDFASIAALGDEFSGMFGGLAPT